MDVLTNEGPRARDLLMGSSTIFKSELGMGAWIREAAGVSVTILYYHGWWSLVRMADPPSLFLDMGKADRGDSTKEMCLFEEMARPTVQGHIPQRSRSCRAEEQGSVQTDTGSCPVILLSFHRCFVQLSHI